ncbi:MAG: hypothetical protein LBL26_05060 [Peptococcaceae bacterium]|jgi:hypothetical protein|nr:hypothetical protein [Peptococcaceae bacterium]
MSSNVITESGMDFAADNTFHIEKSQFYTRLRDGVRSVEFVRVLNDKLMFVEAKTSFANPHNPDKNNYVKFQSAVEEICEKFIHTLNMYSSVEVGTAEEPFPDSFIPPSKVSLVFVLVVKNHENEWCTPIHEKLVKSLPTYLKKIWRPKVYVINHETAKKLNLIAS